MMTGFNDKSEMTNVKVTNEGAIKVAFENMPTTDEGSVKVNVENMPVEPFVMPISDDGSIKVDIDKIQTTEDGNVKVAIDGVQTTEAGSVKVVIEGVQPTENGAITVIQTSDQEVVLNASILQLSTENTAIEINKKVTEISIINCSGTDDITMTAKEKTYQIGAGLTIDFPINDTLESITLVSTGADTKTQLVIKGIE